MMLNSSTFFTNFLSSFLIGSKYFGASLFQYNRKSRKLEIRESEWFQKQFQFRLNFAWLLTLYSVWETYQFRRKWKAQQKSGDSLADAETDTTITLQLFYIGCFTAFTYVNQVHMKKQKEIRNLYNAMQSFENEYIDYQNKKGPPFSSKLFLLYTVLVIIPVQAGRALIIYTFPCVLDVVASSQIPECKLEENASGLAKMTSSHSFELTKMVVIIMNFTIYGGFYFGFIAELVCFSHIPGVFINQQIQAANRYMKDKTKSPYKKVLFFRQLQLMLISHNWIHKSYAVVAALGQSVFLMTICLYCLVNLHASLLPVHVSFFLSTAAQCFTTIIAVGGTLGDVYSNSGQLLEDIKAEIPLQKNTWFRRSFKSWPVQKIRFGQVNFLDRLSPVTLVDFSINLTLNMVLVKSA
ncbi:unnamed protein product [Orchesella dallaii]|uniref:Gustatory receptor n=1 Tax=Orchesella dallaii TaxID=48710 RepID=A0ABP1Q338_9HEXA